MDASQTLAQGRPTSRSAQRASRHFWPVYYPAPPFRDRARAAGLQAHVGCNRFTPLHRHRLGSEKSQRCFDRKLRESHLNDGRGGGHRYGSLRRGEGKQARTLPDSQRRLAGLDSSFFKCTIL